MFTKDRLWVLDRNFPGAARLASLTTVTHVLVRLKSDITAHQGPRGSSPMGPTSQSIGGERREYHRIRVIEYYVKVEGQDVPEMFCLVTDLQDWEEYPAADLAGLYRWRWDGSETALRRRSQPSPAPARRPGRCPVQYPGPDPAGARRLGRRRGHRTAGRPRRRPRRASPPGRAAAPGSLSPREISFTAARRAVIAAVRHGAASYALLARALGRCRTVTDRTGTAPARQKPAPHSPAPTRHRHPHRRSSHHRLQHNRLTSKNPIPALDDRPPARGAHRHPHETPAPIP